MKKYIIIVAALLALSGCQTKEEDDFLPLLLALAGNTDVYQWDLPAGFPEPVVPENNPMSQAKVDLGRRLFYDTRLSLNETQSCASCHLQSLAFTDGLKTGVGSTGMVHPRNSQGLVNVAYNTRQTWANPMIETLEDQISGPLFGTTPVELGMDNQEDELIARLSSVSVYQEGFTQAFGENSITLGNVIMAIASFERTMISGNSPYDKFVQGIDTTAMTPSQIRGMNIFFGETAECFHCHGGFNFNDSSTHTEIVSPEIVYHNTGLYNVGGNNEYPSGNQGLYEVTLNVADKGKFKAPSLRNVEMTAPYFHDGSAATLYDVVDSYMAGGRNILATDPLLGAYAGDGRLNIYKNGLVSGFTLTATERDDLVNFLKSLTDQEFLTNPALSNPWN